MPELPDGFAYYPAFVSEREQQALLAGVRPLAFSEVRMHGVVAKRRVAHFGWNYGYESWRVTPGPPVPGFLLDLRGRAAGLAGLAAEALAEVLVTEYPPGAGIGWHRDAPPFGIIVGVSLLGSGRFKLRRSGERQHETVEVQLEPRSAYVLSGEARSHWQHSLPPVKGHRYSITFRTLRNRKAPA